MRSSTLFGLVGLCTIASATGSDGNWKDDKKNPSYDNGQWHPWYTAGGGSGCQCQCQCTQQTTCDAAPTGYDQPSYTESAPTMTETDSANTMQPTSFDTATSTDTAAATEMTDISSQTDMKTGTAKPTAESTDTTNNGYSDMSSALGTMQTTTTSAPAAPTKTMDSNTMTKRYNNRIPKRQDGADTYEDSWMAYPEGYDPPTDFATVIVKA